MTIKIKIDRNYAVVAMMYFMYIDGSWGVKIKSQKQFKDQIRSYLVKYGELCIDDHESEHDQYRDQAESIVDKFFKL